MTPPPRRITHLSMPRSNTTRSVSSSQPLRVWPETFMGELPTASHADASYSRPMQLGT